MIPGGLPERSRRCLFANDEGHQIFLDQCSKRSATHARSMADAGAGETVIGSDLDQDDLDMGDVMNGVAPRPARQRQARMADINLLDLH